MEADLRNAFYNAIEAYAVTQGLPLSLPNVSFTPPTEDDMYLRAQTFPTIPNVLTVCGGMARHIWLLQVSVYARDKTGELKALEQADRIKATFPVTYKFTSANHEFVVIAPPSPVPPIATNGWLAIPIQFRVSTIH